ncbi:MAG: tol-pal system-associated acyl-CoA thioesterase [Alcaligenaceae bacterium]|nr:tol-pal system-associated acyl-CoA thioesterase [Alcaligenaceae bacterium]
MSASTPDENKQFTLPVRVYYEDTDSGGVVFYANYLKFFERARTEWLRTLGINQSELAASENRIFVVVNTQLKYRKPARLDDLIQIKSRISKVSEASAIFEQRAELNTQLLVESTIQVCCVNSQTFRPAAIPPSVRTLLLSVQD